MQKGGIFLCDRTKMTSKEGLFILTQKFGINMVLKQTPKRGHSEPKILTALLELKCIVC